MYSLDKEIYRRSLNIQKMLVLQMWGAAHGLSFYLGHCRREIRIRLTLSWLMLNQEKTQMMPVYLKEEVNLHTEKDIFPFYAACIPTICYAHY